MMTRSSYTSSRALPAVALIAVTIWCLGTPAGPAHAAATPHLSPQALEEAVARERAIFGRFADWMNQPFKPDPNSAYVDFEHHIDQQIASGQQPDTVFAACKNQWQLRPNQPAALFGCVYAAILAQRSHAGWPNRDADETIMKFIQQVGGSAPPPHVLSFVRLGVLSLPGDIRLAGAGKRLLANDPDDLDVEYALARDLAGSGSSSDRKEASKYAQDIMSRQPNDVRSYSLKASVDYSDAWESHDPALADKCIEDYEHCITMTPAGTDKRRVFDLDIEAVRKLKAKWAAHAASGNK